MMIQVHPKRFSFCRTALWVLWSGLALWSVQGCGQPADPDNPSSYSFPRLHNGRGFEVDAGWPGRPEAMAWGEMSGVAIDGQERIWLFTREEPAIQIYDRSGRFIRSWGKGQFKKPHFLRFDSEGNVFFSGSLIRFVPSTETFTIFDGISCTAALEIDPSDDIHCAGGDSFVKIT